VNRELRDRWCVALRSRDYMQGLGRLRTSDNCYCCLGVLADVMGVDWDKDEAEYADYSAHGSFGGLSIDLLDRAGLTLDDQGNCIKWNDKDGLSFDEIADKIEQEF